ncbi:hypothetical protein CC2G_004297 [Coprinopsis cinerea AmutBmut pab1-1]|nr:hypothetical protein CC2G_004297 [Coprinopsis cinerea AmutBmut pab1-1]
MVWDADPYPSQVVDTLYNVPRHALERESSFFRTLFTVPPGDLEKNSDDNPIHIPQVEKEEFEAIIEILYPSEIRHEWTRDQLIAALRLARLWEMDAVVQFIEESLRNLKLPLSEVDKIILGKKHSLAKLLADGYLSFMTSDTPLSVELANQIGWDSIGHIAFVRQEFRQDWRFKPKLVCSISGAQCSQPGCGGYLTKDNPRGRSSRIEDLGCQSCKTMSSMVVLSDVEKELPTEADPEDVRKVLEKALSRVFQSSGESKGSD